MHPTRRQVLSALAAAGAATLVDPGKVLAKLAVDVPCAGLDARLVTDLSILEPGRLITPNELAYIRTEIPAAAAAHTGPWTIETSGLLAKNGTLDLNALSKQSKPMGAHLFECSGNGNPSNFGLMSVAEWEGIPLVSVVASLKPAHDATAVLVSGFDHIGQVSQRSIVGASWVFPLASLDKLGAFLAVRMNGEAVPADHGKPVRLVVPGWYGCAWIKWVNEIRLVGPDEPATTQMVEFANRTHQAEPHKLAKDHTPADIQTAATPVRVEKRRTTTGIEYRIVGILWGARRPSIAWRSEFKPQAPSRISSPKPQVPSPISSPKPRTSERPGVWGTCPQAPGPKPQAVF